MAAAFAAAREVSGIDFGAQEPRLRVIDDEYGRESLRFIIYWRGADAAGGSPAGLRLDITRQGIVMFDPLLRTMAHPFSDTDELGEVRLLCYVLDEVIAEKVRAVLGQRIYSVSRDLYDIFSLIEHVDDRKVLTGLPRKMDARDVGTESVDLLRMEEWKNEFRADWNRTLARLLPPGAERPFDEVWDAVVVYLAELVEALDSHHKGAQ